MRMKLLTVGAVLLVAVGVWHVPAAQENGDEAKSRREAAAVQQHGAYLVSRVALCGDCHTPQNDRDKSDSARRLRGASLPFRPKKKTQGWADEAPDITASGLAGKWSQEEMIQLLMTGSNPDGNKARPLMPAFRLSAGDARAVALYLKFLPGSKQDRDKEKRSKDSQ